MQRFLVYGLLVIISLGGTFLGTQILVLKKTVSNQAETIKQQAASIATLDASNKSLQQGLATANENIQENIREVQRLQQADNQILNELHAKEAEIVDPEKERQDRESREAKPDDFVLELNKTIHCEVSNFTRAKKCGGLK